MYMCCGAAMAAAGEEPVEPPFLSVCMFEELFDAPMTPGEEMNPQQWSRLPQEVLEEVLVVLPASSQARFRIVCKAWRNLLTSGPFRTRSAAIAFSRRQSFCAVSHSWFEDVSELDPRYKVHKVSLEFLPSQFQELPLIVCRQGLILITSLESGIKWPSYTNCVVNPVNQTYRVLPLLDCFWQAIFGIRVEEDGEGKFSFTAYADERYDNYDVSYDDTCWAAYRSNSNNWEDLHIKASQRTDDYDRAVYMVKEAFCVVDGSGTAGIGIYDQRSGELVHKVPTWEQEAVAHVNFSEQDEQVVALAFSTTDENVCEVWKVEGSGTAWVKVAAMPHGVLWPLNDACFPSVRSVEVLGNVAFISVLGYDKPVHTWKAFDSWTNSFSAGPTQGFLVAFDVVQGSWKTVCDRWPYKFRHVIQPNPAIDVSWGGEPSSSK